MCHPSEVIDVPFSNGRRNRRPRSDPPSSPHRPFSILILIMTIGSCSKSSATTSDHPPSSSSSANSSLHASAKTSATTSDHHPPPSSSSTSTSTSNSSLHACAACKYQRRKCQPDCILAPYFPASQPRQFKNAHRLFGVSKMLKIISHLEPRRRPHAMRSIIFQSNARAHDPVGGCYHIIRDLERLLQRHHAELALVRRQLAICRAQAQAQARAQTQPNLSPAHLNNLPNFLLNPPDDDGGGGDDTAQANLSPAHLNNIPNLLLDLPHDDDGGGGGDTTQAKLSPAHLNNLPNTLLNPTDDDGGGDIAQANLSPAHLNILPNLNGGNNLLNLLLKLPDDGGGGGGGGASYDSHFVQPQQCLYDFCCYGGGGGNDHCDDYGYADNMFISITDSLKNGQNYRDAGIIGFKLPASPQQQEECMDAKMVGEMFDDSSRNNTGACTSTKVSQRRPKHDPSGAASSFTLTNSTDTSAA